MSFPVLVKTPCFPTFRAHSPGVSNTFYSVFNFSRSLSAQVLKNICARTRQTNKTTLVPSPSVRKIERNVYLSHQQKWSQATSPVRCSLPYKHVYRGKDGSYFEPILYVFFFSTQRLGRLITTTESKIQSSFAIGFSTRLFWSREFQCPFRTLVVVDVHTSFYVTIIRAGATFCETPCKTFLINNCNYL